MIRLSIQARQALAKLTLPVLFALSFGLILLGKVDSMLAERARMSLGDVLAPFYGAIAVPIAKVEGTVADFLELWSIRAENERLRAENDRLRQWQAAALTLEVENERLKANLNWVPSPQAAFVTARVVSDAGGIYARAALASLGPSHFVRKGMVVLDERGVVGRVVDVGSRSARILLITDMNSRIPVLLLQSRSHAIMAGTNAPRPHLMYWTEAAPQEGEQVVTSGEGGALPPDLPLGIVHYSTDHVPEVVPDASLDQLRLVRIVDFDLSGESPAAGSGLLPAHGG